MRKGCESWEDREGKSRIGKQFQHTRRKIISIAHNQPTLKATESHD